MNTPQRRYWIDLVIGSLIGSLAGIVYFTTLSPTAAPGIFSSIITRYAGLLPKLDPNHPFWTAIVRSLAAAGDPSGLSYRLNAFSAVCGSLCIWILYDVMSSAIYLLIEHSPLSRIRRVVAARCAGIAAALALAFCIPFWTIATRAHMLSFHILVLLCITRLLISYVASGKLWLTYVFAFVYGASIVEFSTMIPLSLLFGPFILLAMWKNEELRPATALGLLFCGIAGLSLYLPTAWAYHGSLGSSLRGYNSWFQVVWIMWRDQVRVLSSGLPAVGGLLIIICTVIPWLTALFVAQRALNEEKDWAYYILHVVMTALAVPVILGIDYVSPWKIAGAGRPLVTPYLLIAMLFGYLVAYWLLAPYTWISDPDEEEKKKRLWRRTLGPLLITPLLLLALLIPAKNFKDVDASENAIISRFANQAVKSMEGRKWLISNTPFFDDPIVIAAHEQGQAINVLNLRRGGDSLYMKYIATLFDDVRLKNLTSVSALNLCHEWFERDPSITESVAVLDDPNIWIAANYTPLPNQTLYLGTSDPASSADKMIANNMAFWKNEIPALNTPVDTNGLAAAVTGFVVNHLGTIANNSGVLLEDIEQPENAANAYLKALEIDPQNISAMLNLVMMVNRGHKLAESENIQQQYQEFQDSPGKHSALWHLARTYGYVRTPHAFVEMGMSWALSGERGLAISGIKRAMALTEEGKRGPLKLNLAGMYFKNHQPEKSEAIYKETLDGDPQNKVALLGMARLLSMRGEFEEAKQHLARALAAGVPKTAITLEYATAQLRAGNVPRARVLLEDLLQENPKLIPAQILLAEARLKQKDLDALRKQLPELEDIPEIRSYAKILEGLLAIEELDWNAAGAAFEASIQAEPENSLALEHLLRVDLTLRRRGQAGEHALALLRLDPANALANYLMGTFEVESRTYERAEDFFRKSLNRKRDYFALNDLGWVLCELNQLKEAEELAREALTISDAVHMAWDTLGVILTKKGDFKEALTSLERARALSLDATPVLLHLGQLHLRKKNLEKVREVITILTPRTGTMSEDQSEELSLLKRESRL